MGVLIGESSFYPTWAALRRPIMSSASTVTVAQNNIVWNDGFRTTEGNGFVRREPTFPYLGGPTLRINAGSPTDFYLKDATVNIEMDQRDADELIGSDVTSGTGTITLTATYLTNPGQDITGSTYTDPAVTIVKLTAF